MKKPPLTMLAESLPGWIETSAIGLTIFLLWFGFSQLSMIRNGLSLWRGAHKFLTKLRMA